MKYFDISTYDIHADAARVGVPVAGPHVMPAMIWVDLESTGLDVRKDKMLEFGMVLTTAYGEVIDGSAFQAYVDQDMHHIGDIGNLRDSCDEFVQKMHDKSELWDDLIEAHERGEALTVSELEDAILQYFEDRDLPENVFPMCGSSVDFDRKFVTRYMPQVANSEGPNGFFHYRVIDVSTLKGVAAIVNPGLADSCPEPRKMHRVIPDLLDTIGEYRYYLDELIYTERDAERVGL